MIVEKHKGHGQTYCVGCMVLGVQPLQWDSMIIEVKYEDGKTFGCFCSSCFSIVKNYLKIELE